VLGREHELALADAFLGFEAGRSRVMLLEGEAGVGKTTLWLAAVQRARELGFQVLEARPAASEGELSFAGLGDLLAQGHDEVGGLPGPQRRALRIALLLEESDGKAPEPRAVGPAVLGLFRRLAVKEKLLIAIDDVQWLDAATAAAVAYAARRLRDEPIGLLLARRAGLESALVDELRGNSGLDRYVHLDVGPLDSTALHQVVHGHLGVSLPRPLLSEVHLASGGNPFYALEIVRSLTRSGVSVGAGRPLPVPDSLHDLVHGRLLALPSDSRDFLIAAAAHAHPTISITETATGVGRAVGLVPAVHARIVEVDGDRIRFTHPLLAAGALESADPRRRSEIHARLAELLEDPEARAWQLAASVDEPDEDVARALEHAAEHARARGGLRPAALLLDRARELTPLERRHDAVRRAVDAAFLHFESGDSPRAEAQLRAVIDPSVPREQRAKALWVLARVRTYDAPGDAVELFLQLVDEAQGDPELLAVAHEGVASSLLWLLERFPEQIEHAEATLAFALERGDEALAGDALVSKLLAEAWLGLSIAEATANTALDLQDSTADRRLLDQPVIALVQYWWWIDQPKRARDVLIELLQRARELGDESSRPYVLSLLGQVEYLLGNHESALDCAREGNDAAEQSGQPLFAAYHLALESLVRGRPEHALEAIRRAEALIPVTGGEGGFLAYSALGHVELALGNSERSAASLEPLVQRVRREGIAEPAAVRFVCDLVEALLELGRREEAAEVLDWYEANARRLERVSALANCARCRGMLAAQAGELDSAFAAYEEALEWHAKAGLPLDRGRTLLALGAAQRRAKRRREARETLEEALAIFERIGAALWAERARGEMSRISGRAATPGALTPAEERVAALVAEGKTNREVAGTLFLSDRTVEGHLSRIFGKLGIKHRAELGPALTARQTQRDDASQTGDSRISTKGTAP
jgi:DNA-binding CsgD family transcriptional regulator